MSKSSFLTSLFAALVKRIISKGILISKDDSIEYKLKNRFRTAILEKYLRIYGKNIQEDLSSLHLFTENDSCIDYFFDYIENNFDNPLDKLLEIVTEKRRLNRKNLLWYQEISSLIL